MGTKTKSWWLDHGIGCRVNNESWVDDITEDTGRLIPPEEFVEGCILEYYYVEVIHAGIQCLLALTGFVFTLMAIYIYGEDQESCKYPLSARTYISPKDYPSTRYAPIDAVQQARHSWCQPTYVTYNQAMQWSQSTIPTDTKPQQYDSANLDNQSTGSVSQTGYHQQTVIDMEDQIDNQSGHNVYNGHSNSYSVAPMGYVEYPTGTRMRMDTASRGSNSTSLWVNGPMTEEFGTVSPV